MYSLSLDNHADIREITYNISQTMRSRISGYVDTVRNHFNPVSVFGSCFIYSTKSSGQENPKNAAGDFAQLTALYKQIAAQPPLNLDGELPDTIEIGWATPALFPFVYPHDIATRTGTKRLTVSCPFHFVLAFPACPFSDLRNLVNTHGPKDKLREFVLHYLVMNYVVMRNKRLLALFEDLRFPLRSERFDELGALPITTISAPAGSVRPPDAVIAQICRYSGADTAEELADFEAWRKLPDPLAGLFEAEAAKLVPADAVS